MINIFDFLDSERIYAKVDELRRTKGLTIHEMAKKAGVSYSAIYKWRDRQSAPSLALLESLSEVLGVHIINLLVKDDDMVYLPEWQKEIFDKITVLSNNQKQLLESFLNVLVQKENQNDNTLAK